MSIKENKRRIALWLLSATVLLTVGFIFSNSLKNSAESYSDSDSLTDLFGPLVKAVFGEEADVSFWVRKAAHFAEFFILGVLSCSTVAFVGRRLAGYVWFFVLAVAVIDEFVQKFTGRTSAVSDVIIDFCGAASGCLIVIALRAVVLRFRKKRKDSQTGDSVSCEKGFAK